MDLVAPIAELVQQIAPVCIAPTFALGARIRAPDVLADLGQAVQAVQLQQHQPAVPDEEM